MPAFPWDLDAGKHLFHGLAQSDAKKWIFGGLSNTIPRIDLTGRGLRMQDGFCRCFST
jgi:hypothetical protein